MSSVIRKISIGSDYKNDAMHYSIGQEVYGGHIICDILNNEKSGEYSIYIKKNNEVLPWKRFNSQMAIAVEFDLKY
tara:strand:+ start:29 stop:256 length:228 start_codon:yes stop_codon:yes gene_type:complete